MKIFNIIGSFLFVAGCASSLPVPVTTDIISDPSISIEELTEGRSLYIAKCSGCHGLYLPSQFTGSHWQSILPTMKEKSKISVPESKKIEQYLLQYSLK